MKKRIGILLGALAMLALLTGCKCEHNFSEWTTVHIATCTEEGVQERTCLECNQVEERAIMMANHNYAEWKTVAEPTCTLEGLQERRCEQCGGAEERAIMMLAHTFGEWSITQESTCTTAGVQNRSCQICGSVEEAPAELKEHAYVAGTVIKQATCTENGEQVKKCSVCADEQTFVIQAAHSWKKATCTTPETCSKCGQTHGSAGGHTWKSATSVKPKQCSTCGVTEGKALGITIKDMSNTYLFYNNKVTIRDNGNGTVTFKAECMKGTSPKTSYVRMVGYDANGNQTFTTVEPTYYMNVVYSYLQYKAVPAATVTIHLSDYLG